MAEKKNLSVEYSKQSLDILNLYTEHQAKLQYITLVCVDNEKVRNLVVSLQINKIPTVLLANKNNILVIGNPPFGKVSSIAIKFFNHSSIWSNVIAFIIPRTFRRPSVQNKLNKMFHLTYDEDVSTKPCCFTPRLMVKCCFQIWEKRENKRILIDHRCRKYSDHRRHY